MDSDGKDGLRAAGIHRKISLVPSTLTLQADRRCVFDFS